MSVLLLSPDCLYERETALVQRSGSLVYPSTLHLHGQQRLLELMGLGAAFSHDSTGLQSQTAAALLFEKEDMWWWGGGVGADMQTQTTSERLRGAGTAAVAAASGAAPKNKEKLKEYIHFFLPQPLFLSTRLVMSLSNHFLMLLEERSGFSRVL